MNSPAASHRTLLLLALVVSASRGLSFSRGNLSDIGVICFVAVLIGLAVLLLYRAPWDRSSDSKGGFPTWQVALPCAFVYMFAIGAGRHLLVFAPGHWCSILSTITWIALVAALPSLLLASARMRSRLSSGAQLALLLLPLVPAVLLFALVPAASPRPAIDVFVFETQAARSLLFGLNPYDMTYANLYDSAEFYPSGDPDSYPYPPLSWSSPIFS